MELEPAVVVVDDAQCRWLAYVGRRVEELPVVLLLAVRSGDRAAAPDALAAVEQASAQHLQLDSLSLNATRELLVGRLVAPRQDAVVSACHRATGGNPFLIEEIVAALRAVAGPIGPEAVEALAAGRVASRRPYPTAAAGQPRDAVEHRVAEALGDCCACQRP